mgnify:CR=1 FL=1
MRINSVRLAVLFLICSSAFAQQEIVEKATGFYPVTFFELMQDPARFDGRKIEVFGYLGNPWDDAILFALEDYAKYGQVWYGLAVVYNKDVKIMSKQVTGDELKRLLKKNGWKYVVLRGQFVNKRHGLTGALFGALHVEELLVPKRF